MSRIVSSLSMLIRAPLHARHLSPHRMFPACKPSEFPNKFMISICMNYDAFITCKEDFKTIQLIIQLHPASSKPMERNADATYPLPSNHIPYNIAHMNPLPTP